MSMADSMMVTLRLPTRTLFEGAAKRVSAVAPSGSFGLLPNHIDFVTALVPSVISVWLPDSSEAIFGVDEGLLVKKGHAVSIATLRGVRGDDLGSLRDTIRTSFIEMDEEERKARSAMSRLEADMVRRFAELQRRLI